MTQTETIQNCPGCGEPLVDSPELGDVVTFDSRAVNGEWHEVCGSDAKDDVR